MKENAMLIKIYHWLLEIDGRDNKTVSGPDFVSEFIEVHSLVDSHTLSATEFDRNHLCCENISN